MPSPIYQYVIYLVMSLPIRRGPGVIMNVSVLEHRAFNNYIFGCGKVYTRTENKKKPTLQIFCTPIYGKLSIKESGTQQFFLQY
jgi:hypothetical protein